MNRWLDVTLTLFVTLTLYTFALLLMDGHVVDVGYARRWQPDCPALCEDFVRSSDEWCARNLLGPAPRQPEGCGCVVSSRAGRAQRDPATGNRPARSDGGTR